MADTDSPKPSPLVPKKGADVPARTPYGYRVTEAKKTSMYQFQAGKILPLRAYGQAGIDRLRASGVKLEAVMDEPA